MDKNINKFTHFQRHSDNAGEVIEGEDINKIQETVNKQEKINVERSETEFLNRCLFILENHFAVNSGFIDELEDLNNISSMQNDYQNNTFEFDFDDTSLKISPGIDKNVIHTKEINSEVDNDQAFLNDFLLLVDATIPQGASIEYYISTDFGDFPIKPSKENSLKIQKSILNFQLKIIMTRNSLGQSPKLFSFGILFFDIFLEKKYGLINPDLSRFEKQVMGDTVLIRDRGLGDKLIRVIAPDSLTDLVYRGDGKLDYIQSIEGEEEIKTTLNYGDYFDSNGVISEKLLSISSEDIKTKDTEKTPFEGGEDNEN